MILFLAKLNMVTESKKDKNIDPCLMNQWFKIKSRNKILGQIVYYLNSKITTFRLNKKKKQTNKNNSS